MVINLNPSHHPRYIIFLTFSTFLAFCQKNRISTVLPLVLCWETETRGGHNSWPWRARTHGNLVSCHLSLETASSALLSRFDPFSPLIQVLLFLFVITNFLFFLGTDLSYWSSYKKYVLRLRLNLWPLNSQLWSLSIFIYKVVRGFEETLHIRKTVC